MLPEESKPMIEETGELQIDTNSIDDQKEKIDEKKFFANFGLWFSVFYYSSFQVIGSLFGVILLMIFSTFQIIEVDANGYYDQNSTNVIYALLIVNLIATVIIGFIIFGMNRKTKFIPSKIGFKISKKDLKILGYGFALIFFIVAGLQTIISLIENKFFPDFSVETPYDFFNSGNLGVIIFAIILVSIGAPIAEEIFYRWSMIQTLKQGMNKYAAITFSSIIFAFAHSSVDLTYSFYYFVIHFIFTFLIGLILGTIYFLTEKVILVTILHAAWNFIISLSAIFDYFNLYNVYFIIYLVIIGLAGIGTIVGSTLIILKKTKKPKTQEPYKQQEKTKIDLRPEWFSLILGYFGLIVLIPLVIQLVTSYFSFGKGLIEIAYLCSLLILSVFLIINQNRKYQWIESKKVNEILNLGQEEVTELK